MNFQMFKLVLEKSEEPEIKLPASTGSWKKQESSRRNIYFCFIDYAKTFDYVDHNKLRKIWKTQQWPQGCKRSVFIPIQRKAMPKNVQTTTQWHSFHTLVK